MRRQTLTTAGERGADVVVSQGLAGGEALVLGPAEGLREGARVEMVKKGS